MTNFVLMLTFSKFGLLCFGGGYMIIPMLLHTFVEKTGLLTLEVYGNLISLSQITPGPVSINAATYVGYLNSGIFGGILASIGLVLPGIFLAFTAVRFLQKGRGTFVIDGLLTAMRFSALAMVLYACLIFMEMSVFSKQVPWKELYRFLTFQPAYFKGFYVNYLETIICCFSFLIVRYTKIPITYLLLFTGGFGAIFGFFIQ